MRGWLRALRRELTRGVPLLTFAAVAATVIVLLWSNGAQWGGQWNALAGLTREYLILVAGIVVAFAAWQGGRASRDGVGELLASTRAPTLLRQSVEVIAVALAAYLGWLLAVATAGLSIVHLGGWGSSAAVYQILGMAPALLAYAALGYAIGRAMPGRVVAPLAGLATYLLLAVPIYLSESVPVLFGNGALGDDVHRVFSVRGLVLSSAGLAAAAVFFLALAALERRPAPSRPTRAVTAAAAVAMVGIAPLTLATAAAAVHDPAPANPAMVCTSDEGPQVCVHAQDHLVLEETTRQARQVIDMLAGTEAAPTWAGPWALEDVGNPEMLPVQSAELTPWGEVDTTYGEQPLVNPFALFDPMQACADTGSPALPDAELDVFLDRAIPLGYWLTEGIPDWMSSPDSDELSRRFAESTDDQRREFASAVRAAALTCDMVAVRAADHHLAEVPS